MAVITVLGSGIMATALATPLTDNGHEVRLVGTHLDREIITSIQETGIHPNLGLKVPEGVTAHQLEDAPRAFEGVEFVMSGVNSFGVDWAGDQFASLLRPGMHVIALAKGMQADDDVALLHAALQSTSAAGVDDAGGLVFFQKDGGGDGGVYFADAALREQYRFSGQRAAGDGDVRDFFVLRLRDAAL